MNHENSLTTGMPASAVEHKTQLTPKQVDLLKRTVCKGASDDELALFMHVANKAGLDPFTKQLHAVKRKIWNANTQRSEETMTIQVGIDGYRLIAHRTGLCAGIGDGVFTYKEDGTPESATVSVKRLVSGQVCEFLGTAWWDEYAPYHYSKKEKKSVLSSMWKQRPRGQLAKCAEALALRKAFPAELSGMYTKEEMEQADNPPQARPVQTVQTVEATPAPAPQQEKAPSEDVELAFMRKDNLISHIQSLAKEICKDKSLQERGKWMVDNLRVNRFDDLKRAPELELERLIRDLQMPNKEGE